MTNNRATQGALFGFIAILLLGTLAFLYSRTEAIDFKKDAEVLALLRELREHDTRWDFDAALFTAVRHEIDVRIDAADGILATDQKFFAGLERDLGAGGQDYQARYRGHRWQGRRRERHRRHWGRRSFECKTAVAVKKG